jgi:hypothetical protein
MVVLPLDCRALLVWSDWGAEMTQMGRDGGGCLSAAMTIRLTRAMASINQGRSG